MLMIHIHFSIYTQTTYKGIPSKATKTENARYNKLKKRRHSGIPNAKTEIPLSKDKSLTRSYCSCCCYSHYSQWN